MLLDHLQDIFAGLELGTSCQDDIGDLAQVGAAYLAGSAIAAETPWQKAAVAAAVDDLYTYQSTLASRVISETNGARDPVESWLAPRLRVVERVDQLMNDVRAAQSVDLAMLTVASRQLRVLVES